MPETLRQAQFDQTTRPFTPDLSVYKPTEKHVDVATEDALTKKNSREKLGSDAFNLEYEYRPTRAELGRDIISYLGEYRLQVQKHRYDLVYGRDKDHRGEISLRDRDRGMSLQQMAKRTLQSRESEDKPTHREEAEELGLARLNERLRTSNDGDTVVWASPPGPKEQGYGDYGFVYVGKVQKLGDQGERYVPMTAIRVEKPNASSEDNNPWVTQSGKVINTLTGQNIAYETAEDFLANPQVIRAEIPDRIIDQTLQESFHFTPNEAEQEQMSLIIKKMEPLIDEFYPLMETASREEKLRAFYALENYAIALKEEMEGNQGKTVIYEDKKVTAPNLNRLIWTGGHKPPPVAGSCGSTGGMQSNGLSSINGGSRLNSLVGGGASEDEYGALDFECPVGHKNTRPRGTLIPSCETCGVSVSC